MSKCALASVLFERVVAPVAETIRIFLGISAAHCDEGEGEHNEDQDDLAAGQPEFGFAEDLDGKDVEDTVKLCEREN